MTDVKTSTKKTLKEHLTGVCESNGYDTDNDNLFELLEEDYKTVVEDDHDEHRWYTNFRVVKEVCIEEELRYFEYWDMSTHGDGSKFDNDWEIPKVEDICEVYAREVVTTIYK